MGRSASIVDFIVYEFRLVIIVKWFHGFDLVFFCFNERFTWKMIIEFQSSSKKIHR